MNSFCRYFILAITGLFCLAACNTPLAVGSRKTAFEKYRDGLQDAGLIGSRMATDWIAAADKSLAQPALVTLPYREQGFFPAESPSAAGFSFEAKRGEVINISLAVTPASGFRVFMELWQQEGSSRELLAGIDSIPGKISQEIKADGRYILRVQPELLQAVGYSLSISTAPSLAFPVRPQDNPKASSFWGANRDGGRRSHEGVDIFAKKGTPTVAIADGRVTRVNENTLGGKVVWMRPDGADYTLYYAHLDSQLVRDGQRVNRGDVLGLIGNTGNARTTPAHLHFGIYASGGAVDPWPFINVNRKNSADITADTSLLHRTARTGSQEIRLHNGGNSKLEAGTGVLVLAAMGDQLRVALPDGREGFVTAKTISRHPMRQAKIRKAGPVYNQPIGSAAVKKQLPAGTTVSLLASWQEFHFVRSNNDEGWIPRAAL